MSAIPLDVMLWLSAGVFGIGVCFVVPIWWRNWRVRRGADLPITEDDITGQTIARALMLLGLMMGIGTGLTAASQAFSFAAFAAVGGLWIALMLAIAFGVDARRARRHR